jgi:hypothetical protein
MTCPCDENRTVVDFMAETKVKGQHPVIKKMLDALAELDKVTAVGDEQRTINQIRQKIETVAAFAAARLPAAEIKKGKDEVTEHVEI